MILELTQTIIFNFANKEVFIYFLFYLKKKNLINLIFYLNRNKVNFDN